MHVAKIKEFLFKVINNICVCKHLLLRWKNFRFNKCIYCNFHSQTFKHLIWDCPEQEQFWNILENILPKNILYQYMIMGDEDINLNNAISVLMYIIYKKIILDNNNTTDRQRLLIFMKSELKYRNMLYELNHQTSISDVCIPLRYILERL